MAPPSRRDILRASGLAITTTVAGCSGETSTDSSGSPTDAPATTPARSATAEDGGQGWTGGADWPMVHVDAANTAHHPTSTGATDPVTPRWQFDSGKTHDSPSATEAPPAFESSPAVVDGTVYVTTDGGRIYAIAERDGTEIWQFDTGKQGLGAPVVAEGLVHAVAHGHRIHTVDAATGEPQWRFEMGPERLDGVLTSLTVADGTLYVGGTDRKVYVIDAETGTEQWHYETQNELPLTPAVVDDAVYYSAIHFSTNTDNDPHLYALNASDGTERWRHTPEKDSRTVSIRTDPTVSNGSVFVGIRADNPNYTHSASGRVDALGVDEGTVQWQTDTEYPVGNIATDGSTLYVATNSPGHTPEGSLVALDTSDGTERWRRDAENHVYVRPKVVDEKLYVVTSGRQDDPAHIRALRTDDGTEQWAYEFDESSLSGAAVVNGTAYVGEPHTMYALE